LKEKLYSNLNREHKYKESLIIIGNWSNEKIVRRKEDIGIADIRSYYSYTEICMFKEECFSSLG
jgi:soluble P-type ATPase